MDVFEKLNRQFGAWYEGLFGSSSERDLRPRDILRRILATMEDQRREGLDGQVYVPNLYILDIAVADEDERHYLRTFLDADELSAAVRRYMDQHAYRIRGGLRFEINETAAAPAEGTDRVTIRCRFDASLPEQPVGHGGVIAPEDIDDVRRPSAVAAARSMDDYAEEDEPGTMPAVAFGSLVVRMPGGRQEVYPLTTRPVLIGRSRQAGNDIVLAGDGMVSKQHARIAYEGGVYTLHDLGSTNGSFVNDVAVEGKHPLQPGDEIRLGETVLVFRSAAEPSRQAPRQPVVPAAAPAGAFRLRDASGELYWIASEMSVGRALTNDIVIAAEGVAARHAVLTVRDDRVSVEDLSTPAGTFVNGERIPARFAVDVYAGDTIAFGSAAMTLDRSTRA